MRIGPAVTRRLLTVLAALLVAMAAAPVLSAHPTATSFVVIQPSNPHRVTVTVTTEARALLMKLEALAPLAGPPASHAELAPAVIDRRIHELGSVLIAQLDLELDHARANLVVDSIGRLADRPGEIEVRLIATTSAGMANLQWRTSLFFGSYPLAVRAAGATPGAAAVEEYEWLTGAELSRSYDLSNLVQTDSAWLRAARLVGIGFTHILPGGLDHVLFVLGLFLLATNLRTLLLQISAFTLAHSVTLALAMAGWVAVPGRIVEPLIAVSIAYVAIENLVTTKLSRWRLGVVFAFGLLHGLGFAGALATLGLSNGHFAETLVGFNVGVELGQLAVVVAAALLVRTLPVTSANYRRVLVQPASAAIAAMGLFWAVQRVFF
jgi:hypothetical protein